LNQTIAALARMLGNPRWPRFLRSLELFTDETSLQLNALETEAPLARRFFDWCAETIPGLVHGALDYEGRYRVNARSFFQVNRFLVNALVAASMEGLGENTAGETAADLYAGVGLFSIALAQRFGQVQAVEAGASAVRDLEFNAARAGLTNLRAEAGTAEEYLLKLERAPDFVLLDPPRAGLGKVVVRRLVELQPPRLTIVSCDPATLARDLAALLAGGYRLEKLTLVDLFPQTFHLETVARLAR
jgi:23S rRNA (uracil1939-C5)-methyltransferase